MKITFEGLKKRLLGLIEITKAKDFDYYEIQLFRIADTYLMTEARLIIEINNWEVLKEKKELLDLLNDIERRRKFKMLSDKNIPNELRISLVKELKIVETDNSKPTFEYVNYSKEQTKYEVEINKLEIELKIAKERIKELEGK